MKFKNPKKLIISGAALLLFIFLLFNWKYFAYFTVPVVASSPTQPIEFSHKLHAGKNEINCLYCHRSAKISYSAGIPDMALCASCHLYIGFTPEIKKMVKFWQKQTPIPWVKVHDLPDFVHFPHKMHLAAGLACEKCHGEVSQMDRIKREAYISMRWCLDCHKQRNVSIDCLTCHY
jgi:hypothetical protein